jgi:hypothetical protein
MKDDYCLGIDLGTTNSLCAVWQQGEEQPRIVPITQPYSDLAIRGYRREETLSSAVAILPEGVFVGFAAKQLGRLGRGTVITSIKRHMGSHWSRNIAGRTWTPETVSGCILKAILREVQTTFQAPPRQVVITVPASFGTEARRATLKAAQLAGFSPRTTRLFDEPTAALLPQFLQDLGSTPSQPTTTSEESTPATEEKADRQGRGASPPLKPQHLMMIDIGGGTLDVSLLELRHEDGVLVADIQGRSRYNELAGDDFDLQIAGLLLARYEHHHVARSLSQAGPGKTSNDSAHRTRSGHPYSVRDERREVRRNLYYELLLRAEEVKMRLARRANGRSRAQYPAIVEQVVLSLTPDRKPWRTSLSLADLAECLHKFFPYSADEEDRRQDFSFFRPIQQCLDSVHEVTGRRLVFEEVDQVYLAGGSALLPMVPVAVQMVMKQKPQVVANPLQAVALGAAWYAGMLAGYQVPGSLVDQFSRHAESPKGRKSRADSREPEREHPSGSGLSTLASQLSTARDSLSLRVRERLFDGLYLETEAGFVPLLSPREEVPVQERILDGVLSTSRHDRRIEVALYMGSGPGDVNMVPLARRRVDFGTLLPEGHPIRLAIRVSENRQAEFAFTTELDGQLLQGRVEVSAALGWEGEDDPGDELPEINRPLAVVGS